MTGNMPTRNVKNGANKTSGPVEIAPHAGDDVIVGAHGTGATYFSGYFENTSVSNKLGQAFGAKAVLTQEPGKNGKLVGW